MSKHATLKAQIEAYIATLERGQHFTLRDLPEELYGTDANNILNKMVYKQKLNKVHNAGVGGRVAKWAKL